MKALKPKGVLTIIEAEHLCMTMRGIKKTRHTGAYLRSTRHLSRQPRYRAEVMSLIKRALKTRNHRKSQKPQITQIKNVTVLRFDLS